MLILLVLLVISFPFLMAGCGRVDVGIHTTIKSNGDITQQLNITASGMMGSLMSTSMNSIDFQNQGWEVETKQSGDSVSLIATKNFKNDDDLNNIFGPQSGEGSLSVKDSKLDIKNYFIMKDFVFKTTLPGVPAESLIGSNDSDLMSESMINSTLGITWAITLPGNIVETNADNKDGNTATWNFNYSSLQNDREITVHSRYIAWSIIIGIIAGILIIVLAIVFIPKYIKRRQHKEIIESLPTDNFQQKI